MSTYNSIQGNDIVIKLRVAGSSGAYKKMTCEIDNQLQLQNDVTQTETKCQIFVGVKFTKGTVTGNAVHNTDPTSQEVSYTDAAVWQKARQLLEFKYENQPYTDVHGSPVAEGGHLSQTGTAYFNDTTYKGQTGDVTQFAFSLTLASID